LKFDWIAIKNHPYFKKGLKWLRNAIIAFFALSIVGVIIFRWLPIPFTWLMVDRMIEQKWNGKRIVLQKEWVPIEQISDHLVLAVVCSEDNKFEEHNGFDFNAIEKVIEQNKKLRKKGKPIKGASTISQQVAKNVFLYPSRSWVRKGFEVYFTILI
jgi:monofunctional biosynthetic peptidoglycan transglycosylase